MAFEEFKDTIAGTDEDVRSYLKHTEEQLELKVFKILMRLVTTFFQTVLIGSILLLALFVMSMALSYGIGQALGNTSYGFLIVSVFFILFAFFIYVFTKQINKPIIRFFSTHYFENL